MNEKRRAVALKCFQAMASYRMPGSYVTRESYPMPPYSAVIGMVHKACGLSEYTPMQISVQGRSAGSISEPFTSYSFNRSVPFEAERHNVALDDDGKKIGIGRGLGHVELVCDAALLIHILPEDDALVETIAQGLTCPDQYLALGRHEDILRIDSVEIVTVNSVPAEEPITLFYDAYIPEEKASALGCASSTRYLLNKRYELAGGFRKWTQRVRVCLASEGTVIEADEEESVMRDSAGHALFPA